MPSYEIALLVVGTAALAVAWLPRVPAGEVVRSIQQEFGISQPAVSQHLRVLRNSGFATMRPQ